MLAAGFHFNYANGVDQPLEPQYYVAEQAKPEPQAGHQIRQSPQEDGPIEGPQQSQADSPDDE
jgi:hypothetical protein